MNGGQRARVTRGDTKTLKLLKTNEFISQTTIKKNQGRCNSDEEDDGRPGQGRKGDTKSKINNYVQ